MAGRSSIRRSTEADLQAIHAWLSEEKSRGVPGNFLCNWSLTEAKHREGRLLVYVDGASQLPVAYQWGGLIRPGILQVRHDQRGKGIGRKLVQRCIANAEKKDECLLFIECKPSTSIPFWQSMGFTLLDDDGSNSNAYRILERRNQLPSDSKPVEAVIHFYPEERKWDKTTRPCCSATPATAMTANGIVHLGERVFFFEDLYGDVGDPVVEIVIDSKNYYFDKAKYDQARYLGLRRCTNGYFIDAIRASTP